MRTSTRRNDLMAGAAFSAFDRREFGLQLGRLIAPNLGPEQVLEAIDRLLTPLERNQRPAAAITAETATPQPRQQTGGSTRSGARLEFGHDCSHHGCNDQRCNVCKDNPKKRCLSNFADKYTMQDALQARCKQDITVSIVAAGGHAASLDLASRCLLQMCVLDATEARNFLCSGGSSGRSSDVVEACQLLLTAKGLPLLTAGNGAGSHPCPQLAFPHGKHAAPLRGVKVNDNSESVLSRGAPVCLAIYAMDSSTGQRLWDIPPLLSEDFLVLTPRAMNPKKAAYPTMDDPVESLEGIGDQTEAKLKDLKVHVDACPPSVNLHLPPELYQIRKVKDFRALVAHCQRDYDFQHKLLKHVLKVTQDNWRKACDHADRTVRVDHRIRAWYMHDMSYGLLYECTMGDIQPNWPIALLQARGASGQFDIYPKGVHVPAQQQQMRQLTEQAVRDWKHEGHGNTWNIFFQSLPGGGIQEFETVEDILDIARSGGHVHREVPSIPLSGGSQPLPPSKPLPMPIENGSPASAPSSPKSMPLPPITPQPLHESSPLEPSPVAEPNAPEAAKEAATHLLAPLLTGPELGEVVFPDLPGPDDKLLQYLSSLSDVQHASGLESFGGHGNDDLAADPFAAVIGSGNSLPSYLRLPPDCYEPSPSFALISNMGIGAQCHSQLGLVPNSDSRPAFNSTQVNREDLMVMSQEFEKLDMEGEAAAAAQNSLPLSGANDSGRLYNPYPPKRRKTSADCDESADDAA